MMTKIAKRMLLAGVIAAASMTIGGCVTQSESEKTQMKADRATEAASLMRKGEGQITEGKAMEARGRAMSGQDQKVESERLVAEGLALQKSGQAMIDQAKTIRDR